MINRAELKLDAKQKIRGNIGILFLCGLIVTAICGVLATPNYVSMFKAAYEGTEPTVSAFGGLCSFLSAFVIPPFIISMCLIYLNLVNGVRPVVADVFEGFRIYGKTLGLFWWVALFSFLWVLPTYVGMGFAAGGEAVLDTGGSELLGIALIVFGILLTIAAFVFAMYKVLRYSQAFYVLADEPERGVRDCLNESKRLMKGHCGQYFVLGLSFIGWVLLGYLTLCILYIWLVPYMNATYANYYYKLKELDGAPSLAELE